MTRKRSKLRAVPPTPQIEAIPDTRPMPPETAQYAGWFVGDPIEAILRQARENGEEFRKCIENTTRSGVVKE